MFPGVNVNVTNGNLLASIGVLDAVPALIVTVNTSALIAAKTEVYDLADAESKGFTAQAEPFAHKLLDEYYTELAGKQRLIVFGTPDTMTMATALSLNEANGVSKLLREGLGEINLIAIARKPAANYDGAGNGFLDADVSAAVTASKIVAQAMQTANTPVRFFIEGRVANPSVTNTYKPNEATNGFAGVVLGGTANDGSAAVTVALARACKYGAHVKLGNGANGALSVSQIYIGTDKLEDRVDMETLHDAGFITFHHRPGSAGYFFGVDNMCSKDDYRILVHGRIIDKAQRIAVEAYQPYVEGGIHIEDDGSINATDAKDIEGTLLQALRASMGDQVSNVKVNVPLNQDVVNTSTLNVEVKVLPLGYLTWITVSLGLAANL